MPKISLNLSIQDLDYLASEYILILEAFGRINDPFLFRMSGTGILVYKLSCRCQNLSSSLSVKFRLQFQILKMNPWIPISKYMNFEKTSMIRSNYVVFAGTL